MITLNNEKLATTVGGDSIHGACAGLGAAGALVGAGILLNWWNPVGWGGAVVASVVGIGCAGYFVYSNS
jgi:hypothetical protein